MALERRRRVPFHIVDVLRCLVLRLTFALTAALWLLQPYDAWAEPPLWHAEVGTAHAVTDPQAYEYGLGAEGRLAGELLLGRAIGLELEAGALWLPRARPPEDTRISDHGDGVALSALVGARVHPFATLAGPWMDAAVGYVRTGSLDRPGFDAHIGYDWRVGDRWDFGPYVGYFQIVQASGTVVAGDARIVSIGLHVCLEAVRPRPPVAPPVAPPPPAPPPPPPPPAPPPDRDHDGIVDAQDACPDVPGVRTDDPATNGCPPAGDEVRVVADRIEYDERILFDTDQAHVHHASWPILRKLASFIQGNPAIDIVDISGHADERGTAEYNLELSRARAEAVRTLLVSFGVDPDRLTTQAYGKMHPRAEGHSEKEWRENRRVEFHITQVRDALGVPTVVRGTPEGGTP
jgi:outer membrane protein OmpA-like peptidoglycan-associated protein